MPPAPSIPLPLELLDYFGIAVFAVSGALLAAEKRQTLVTFIFFAVATGVGGGTLRDVLLDRRPFFWVERAGWLWVVLALCIAAMLVLRARHLAPTRRALLWPDALGMGLFTANGAQIALDLGMPALVCVLMGVVTAVFGGVLRDVLCNDVPAAFSDHQPYALCAFAGGWVLLGAHALDAPVWLALAAATTAAAALRIVSVYAGIALPPWKVDEGPPK